MKNVSLVIAMALSLVLTATAEAKGKNSAKAQAKKECLADNANLSGKQLQKCIKSKTK